MYILVSRLEAILPSELASILSLRPTVQPVVKTQPINAHQSTNDTPTHRPVYVTSDGFELGVAQIFAILRSSPGVRRLELHYLRSQQQSANPAINTEQVK